MAVTADDPHFRYFRTALERAIEEFKEPDQGAFLVRQKRQVETLVFLEKQFKRTLVAHRFGAAVYQDFIAYICDTRRNILDARPYFRERQDVFTKQISSALRKRNVRRLQRFAFNFRFVRFVLQARKWHPGSALVKLGQQIYKAREELITVNMPLAVSRARIFYSRTPKAHLSYMDLIQIAAEGLMSGIDKFVPPYSKAFRSVAIGRMTGNFIEHYSETPIHFYPVDKRKIYRANKLVGRAIDQFIDFEVLARKVNEDVEEAAHRTTPAEIADLMAAASVVSTDAVTAPGTDQDEDAPRVADRFAAPAECQPDVQVERAQARHSLDAALSCLTIFERKLLMLRGVRDLDSLLESQ